MKSRSQEEVCLAIRRGIVFGQLKPRERLLETGLAEEFNVGRHVIRGALEELDRLGLVQRRPNRGAVIVDYSTSEVDELYEMRALLQREAVRRIPMPVSPTVIAELRALNAAYGERLHVNDLDGMAAANDRFHRTLFGLCRNRYIAEAIEQYWQRTAAIHCYAIGRPDLARQSQRQHDEMIEALAAEDRSRLADLSTEHMQPALGAYKEAHGGWGWQPRP